LGIDNPDSLSDIFPETGDERLNAFLHNDSSALMSRVNRGYKSMSHHRSPDELKRLDCLTAVTILQHMRQTSDLFTETISRELHFVIDQTLRVHTFCRKQMQDARTSTSSAVVLSRLSNQNPRSLLCAVLHQELLNQSTITVDQNVWLRSADSLEGERRVVQPIGTNYIEWRHSREYFAEQYSQRPPINKV
jgi:hypothetical protein